jgi:hypothetical protein
VAPATCPPLKQNAALHRGGVLLLGGGLIANAIELALHRSYRHTQQPANSDG